MRRLPTTWAILCAASACSRPAPPGDAGPGSSVIEAHTEPAGDAGAVSQAPGDGGARSPSSGPRRACDLAEDERKPPYGAACLTQREVGDYASRLKRAIQTNDREAVADLMAYPLTVFTELCAYELRSRRDLIERFDAVIDAHVRSAVASSKEPFFAKVDGVMMGSGEVWLERIDGRPAATSVRGAQWSIPGLHCRERVVEDPPDFLWGTWRVVSAMGVEGRDARGLWNDIKDGTVTLAGPKRAGEREIVRGWKATCEVAQYGYHTDGPSRGESRWYGVWAELPRPYSLMLACDTRGKRHIEPYEVVSGAVLSHYVDGAVVFLRRGRAGGARRIVKRGERCGSLDVVCGPDLWCAALRDGVGRLQETCEPLGP